MVRGEGRAEGRDRWREPWGGSRVAHALYSCCCACNVFKVCSVIVHGACSPWRMKRACGCMWVRVCGSCCSPRPRVSSALSMQSSSCPLTSTSNPLSLPSAVRRLTRAVHLQPRKLPTNSRLSIRLPLCSLSASPLSPPPPSCLAGRIQPSPSCGR